MRAAALFLFWFVAVTPLGAEDVQPVIRETELCSKLEAISNGEDATRSSRAAQVRSMACQLPVDDIDATHAAAALGDANMRIVREGSTITVFARSAHEDSDVKAPTIPRNRRPGIPMN